MITTMIFTDFFDKNILTGSPAVFTCFQCLFTVQNNGSFTRGYLLLRKLAYAMVRINLFEILIC